MYLRGEQPQTARTDPDTGTIRRAYRALARRDLATLRRLSHPEIEVTLRHDPAPEESAATGLDGFAASLARAERDCDRLILTAQTFDQIAAGRVLVRGRTRIVRDRTLTDSPSAWLWELERGLVRSVRPTEAGRLGSPDSP